MGPQGKGSGLVGHFPSCDEGHPSVPLSSGPHTLPALASVKFYPIPLICCLLIPIQCCTYI